MVKKKLTEKELYKYLSLIDAIEGKLEDLKGEEREKN